MSNEGQTPDLTGNRGLQTVRESTYKYALAGCAALSVLTTVGIIGVLFVDAAEFFAVVPITEFFTSTRFSPNLEPVSFGIFPLILGTLLITFGAALLALPIGLLTAIYLSEYASARIRSILKPMLEILAGVPTVVYGYFALVYITPALKATLFPEMSTFNALSASLMVGIMTIPMVSSISEDAMSAVPDSLRQAGYGLGATKYNVSTRIVLPASISGIASSYILAVSRAIGETMIVFVAMGSQARLPPIQEGLFGIPFFNPADALLDTGMTITVAMVQIAGSDLTGGTIPYDSMFALGLTLFIITLIMNVLSNIVSERYREVY